MTLRFATRSVHLRDASNTAATFICTPSTAIGLFARGFLCVKVMSKFARRQSVMRGDAPVGMFPISLPVFMLSVGTIQPKSIESTSRTMNGIFFVEQIKSLLGFETFS